MSPAKNSNSNWFSRFVQEPLRRLISNGKMGKAKKLIGIIAKYNGIHLEEREIVRMIEVLYSLTYIYNSAGNKCPAYKKMLIIDQYRYIVPTQFFALFPLTG